MKFKLSVLCQVFLITIGLTILTAQETISTAGGNAINSGGSMSFSIGQIVYNSITGSNGSIVQGVQQPFEISVVTAIEEDNKIDILISAYPNPTTNTIILNVSPSFVNNIHSMSYQLYDIIGNFLMKEEILNIETSIDMNNFAPSIYFLKVIYNNKQLIKFKIIKN
jgi:hypothetical protein